MEHAEAHLVGHPQCAAANHFSAAVKQSHAAPAECALMPTPESQAILPQSLPFIHFSFTKRCVLNSLILVDTLAHKPSTCLS